jgi:1-acyl-sn-glycerol-3-phosphate acyltransferase
MADHAENLFPDEIDKNEKIVFSGQQSNTSGTGRLGAKLLYWWCWIVAGTMLLFIAIPVLLIARIFNRPYWVYPWALWGAAFWLRRCGAKMKVSGLENLAPDKSYVLISNHRSYLDTAALFICTGRRIGLVAKKELLKVPVMGYGMGFVNILAIDRSNPAKARHTIDRARSVLAEGFSFGVFAEGTRAMPGELLPFKKGAFHLALQTGAPIIPVAIKNTDRLMGKKTGLMFPGEFEVVILPPVDIGGLSAENDLKTLLRNVRETIAAELAAQD